MEIVKNEMQFFIWEPQGIERFGGKGKKTQLQENMIGNKQSWGIQKIDFLFWQWHQIVRIFLVLKEMSWSLIQVQNKGWGEREQKLRSVEKGALCTFVFHLSP